MANIIENVCRCNSDLLITYDESQYHIPASQGDSQECPQHNAPYVIEYWKCNSYGLSDLCAEIHEDFKVHSPATSALIGELYALSSTICNNHSKNIEDEYEGWTTIPRIISTFITSDNEPPNSLSTIINNITYDNEPLKFESKCTSSDIKVKLVKYGSSNNNLSVEYLNSSSQDGVWTKLTNFNTEMIIPICPDANGPETWLKIRAVENADNSSINNDSNYYQFQFNINTTYKELSCTGNVQTLIKQDGTIKDAPAWQFYRLFKGCNAIKTSPRLGAELLYAHCYDEMFCGCKYLNRVKARFVSFAAVGNAIGNATNHWLSGVATNGTFVTINTPTGIMQRDDNYIPNNWNISNSYYYHTQFGNRTHAIGYRNKANRSLPNYITSTNIDSINNSTFITQGHINALYMALHEELNARLKNYLYHNYSNNTASTLSGYMTGPIISSEVFMRLKDAVNNLNTIINESNANRDYEATLSADGLLKTMKNYSITNDNIAVTNIKGFINDITNSYKDCICYSDCGGYAVCFCYGNCNYY